MMNWIQLVTDRTQADIDYRNNLLKVILSGNYTLSLLNEWNRADLKGCYNYTDINRINSAIALIISEANQCGIRLTFGGQLKTNYTVNIDVANISSTLIVTKMNDFMDLLRLFWPPNFAPIPTFGTYIRSIDEANQLESVIKDALTVLELTTNSYQYCGDVYCGA